VANSTISQSVAPDPLGDRPIDPEKLERLEPLGMVLTLVIIFGLVGFIVWAALSPLDIVSIAEGSVTPSGRVQTIQHLEGGIIRKFHVKEGDVVVKGQVLANLDRVASASDYGELTARLHSLGIELVRLEAESKGNDEPNFGEFKKSNPGLVEKVNALFYARRNSLKTNIYAGEKELAQRSEDIKLYTARLTNNHARLKLVEEQVTIGERLIERKLSNRYEQLERLKEKNSIESQLGDDRISLVRAMEAEKAAQAGIETVVNEYQTDVLFQLSNIRQQLNEANERLQKYSDNVKRTELRAPMSGIVKTIYVSTEGGVVAPGGVIMDIVPQDETLIIEAQLPPKDIGHVIIGQKTFFQLSSEEAMEFGRIEGEVEHVSPDTMTTEDGIPYYTIRIRTTETAFKNGESVYKLVPGVLVSVGIVTGQRSVLAYFLEPLFRTLPFTLSER